VEKAEEREERIRQRAYRIWVEEGCPEGKADAHWAMATELVVEENQEFTLKPAHAGLGSAGEPIERLGILDNSDDVSTPPEQREDSTPRRSQR
jgi:hypothetical protein